MIIESVASLMPVSPPVNRDAVLVRREALRGPYFRLTFRHEDVARSARPGQFVMIKAGTTADMPLRRPFSVLGVDPDEGTFDLFIKAIGEGSRGLAGLDPGDLAQCLGPLGRSFPDVPAGEEVLMVAGGYGIAPFLFLANDLRRDGKRGQVFYGGRNVMDLQLREAFAQIGTALTSATDDGSEGVHGRVTEPLLSYLDTVSHPVRLYSCGPDPMLVAVARIAQARGVPAWLSLDPWMGCGVGTCLGCVVPIQHAADENPKLRCACTEGPVFPADVVVLHGDEESAARRNGRESVIS